MKLRVDVSSNFRRSKIDAKRQLIPLTRDIREGSMS